MTRMLVVDIPENPNCEAVELRVFHDLAPAQPVAQVRLEREEKLAWFAVIGWTLQKTPVAASACKVDDSGEGVAILVFGGDAGLRLKAIDDSSPWSLQASSQFGMPFLLLSSLEDVRVTSGNA